MDTLSTNKGINKGSLAHKKFRYGIAINDADYVTSEWDNVTKKQTHCPIYTKWFGMLDRCYSECPSTQKFLQTYKNCAVCEEWLTFSNFKKWMETQDYKGKQLDKDLLVSGNKKYSPETCVFISARLNTTIAKFKQAKTISKNIGKLGVTYGVKLGNKQIGTFKTEQEALNVLKDARIEVLRELLLQETDLRILNNIDSILDNLLTQS